MFSGDRTGREDDRTGRDYTVYSRKTHDELQVNNDEGEFLWRHMIVLLFGCDVKYTQSSSCLFVTRPGSMDQRFQQHVKLRAFTTLGGRCFCCMFNKRCRMGCSMWKHASGKTSSSRISSCGSRCVSYSEPDFNRLVITQPAWMMSLLSKNMLEKQDEKEGVCNQSLHFQES